MKSVKVTPLPLLTNTFAFYVPIQTVNNVLSIYVAFTSNGTIIRIYRYGGSSINESYSTPLTYMLTSVVPSTLWVSPAAWTFSPTATYVQAITLPQVSSTSMVTSILMGTSQLPYYTVPSVTFTVSQVQIFTPYTTMIVGSSIKNSSCITFNYNYQGNPIQVGHCYMFTNDNSTDNQINIYYPLYATWLGSGLPYQDIFAYVYSGDDGTLQAFRI